MRNKSVIAVLLALLLTFVNAGGQDASTQKAKKAKLEEEIEILNRQIKENSTKSRAASKNLKLVRGKVNVRKKMVSESEKKIKGIESEINQKQHNIDSLQDRLSLMMTYYNRLVRKSYKIRDSRTWYVYILSSRDIPQAARRYGYMKRLSAAMNTEALKMKGVKAELDKEKESLGELHKDAEKVRDTRKNELKELQKDERTSAKLVENLKREKAGYQKELAKKKRQVQALDREIRRLIAAAVKKGQGSGSSGKADQKSAGGRVVSTDIDPKLSNEFASNKGRLPWPANGSVVESFGQHYHPVYTNVKLPFNNGVTIAVRPGSAVKAVFEGTVQQIVVMPGYNQCVLVRHGSYFTFYCRLKSVSVRAGEKVKIGQTVGVVDEIDGETMAHFQLWSGTEPQDPEAWLR